MQEQQRVTALARIERVESELEEMLSLWRDELEVQDPSAFKVMLDRGPFLNPAVAPTRPDFEAARQELIDKATASVRREQPMKSWSRIAWTLGFPIAAVTVFFLGAFCVFAGITAALLAQSHATNKWRRELGPACLKRADEMWPAIQAKLQASYEAASDAYERDSKLAGQAWIEQEEVRVEAVRRLIAGEAELVHAAASAALEHLDFPFDAECEIMFDDEDHLMIDIDLPELEDMIPETRYKALRDGALKEVKRKVSDRNRAYSEVVCGIALAVAATALSAAPTLTHVTIAGRTQRPMRRGDGIDDAYVFEAKLPRQLFSTLRSRDLDPIQVLNEQPSSRVQLLSNGSLKKIPAPDWRR